MPPAPAGVVFAATLLLRAPVFLFQGIQASLLPSLTTLEAEGDHARARRATVLTAFYTPPPCRGTYLGDVEGCGYL